jgi:hypothetical protein
LARQAAVSVPQLDVAHVAQLIAVEEIEVVPPMLVAPPLDWVPPVDVPTPPLPPVPVAGFESLLLLPQANIEVARIAEIPRALNVNIVSSDVRI